MFRMPRPWGESLPTFAGDISIDAVVHGAGIIEDRFIREKTAESFDRVMATKVSPLLTIAHKLCKKCHPSC